MRPIHSYHAVPMPFCWHAMPLSVQIVSFPFDLHSAAVSDSHLLRHAHAMPRPCRSSQGYGTSPSKDGLWAACQRSAPSGYHAEFHESWYQKHTNLSCRWPVLNQTRFIMDEEKSGNSTLSKRGTVKLLDQQFGYFRLPSGLPRRTRHYRSMAGLRHGVCDLTARRGRGTAWARNAMCESSFNVVFIGYRGLFFRELKQPGR